MLPWAPLTRAFGPVVSYNLALLTTLILSGVGVYLLVESLTGKRLPGVVASAVYLSAPMLTLRLGGHMNILFGAQFLPYMGLLAHRAVSTEGRQAIWYSIGAGCAYMLSATSSWYFVFIAFPVLVCFFAFGSSAHTKLIRLQRFCICLLTWAVLTAPLALLTHSANTAMFGETVGFSLASSDVWSVGPDRLFVPNALSTLLRGLYHRYWRVQSEADLASLGYTAILLSLVGLWKGKGMPGRRASLALTALAVTLSMGLTLHWNQQRVTLALPEALAGPYLGATGWLTSAITPDPVVPMPGLLLARFVPFYAMMRAWARFMIPAMLGVAVWVGYGACALQSIKRIGPYLAVLAAALILAEGAVIPYRDWTAIEAMQRPVDRWLAQQPAGTPVVEYPWPHRNNSALYSQIVHGQPIVNGNAPHLPAHLAQAGNLTDTWPDEAAVATLRGWGVRYLLATTTEAQADEVLENLRGLPGLRWIETFRNTGSLASTQVHLFEIHDE
jgi:hypothetical protein